MVMNAIQNLKDQGLYPQKLWEENKVENSNKISEVTEAFNLPGELEECIPYGSGHINDTYRLTCENPDRIRRYILQRMSRRILRIL